MSNSLPPPPPPHSPTSHLSNNINSNKKIAAVFASKHIPKLIINNTGLEYKEVKGPEEQNHELDEIKAAVAVAAESKDTNLQNHEPAVAAVAAEESKNDKPLLETKEPSPEPDEKIAVAVAAESKDTNLSLETIEPSPEQHEKIAVAVAAEESKHGNVVRISSNHKNTNNKSQIIINALKQEIKNKENKIVSLRNEKKAAEEAKLLAEIDIFDSERAQKAAEDQKNDAVIAQLQAEIAQKAAETAQKAAISEKDAAVRAKNIAEREKAAIESYFTEVTAKNTAISEKDAAEREKKAAETLLQTKQNELVSTQENLQTTQNELVSTKTLLETTQENFKKIQSDRKIVSSDEYKNLTIKFKEYVIYILNEIKDDKNTSSIIRVIEKTIRNDTDKKYDINELKIRELETGVLKEYYNNLPNTLSSRERIKLLIIYILSTYECKEHYNEGVNIMELEYYGINDGGNLIKNIYVVCKFFNNFVLDIKNHKEGKEYTYVNELLMSDLQMYYGIPEYFKEKINKEEPILSHIEKCKMYALYVLQNINLDK